MRTLSIFFILLSGCAISDDLGQRVGPGSANYRYTHTRVDGSKCTVDILSGRDVEGADLSVDKDCALNSKADRTVGVEKALGTMDKAIDLIKELSTKVP